MVLGASIALAGYIMVDTNKKGPDVWYKHLGLTFCEALFLISFDRDASFLLDCCLSSHDLGLSHSRGELNQW